MGMVTVVVSLGFLGKIECGEETWSGRVDLRVIVWRCIQILRPNVKRVFALCSCRGRNNKKQKYIHTYTREQR